MINDKVKMIIENLKLSTENGELDWIDKGPVDKRNYHREYSAVAEVAVSITVSPWQKV